MDPVSLSMNLRRWRGLKLRDVTIAGAVDAQIKELAKSVRALEGLKLDWAATVPAGLSERCVPVRFSRGTLVVKASDSASAFEFDRWLRTGGQQRLGDGGVKRVRVEQ